MKTIQNANYNIDKILYTKINKHVPGTYYWLLLTNISTKYKYR